jgi:galactokinase
MVSFVEADKVEIFDRHVRRSYLAATGIQAEIYPVSASAGTGYLPPE